MTVLAASAQPGTNLLTSRPLRFCMITTFFPPYSFGGDGIFVQRLARELADRGHEVSVIHCIDSYRMLAGHEPTDTVDSPPGVTVHGLSSPAGALSPLATQQTGAPWFKSREIERILSQGFDVIHYHNISLIGGPAVLRLGKGIKLYTMHEYWLVCPTHSLYKFNREPCLEPQCLPCILAHQRPPQLWRYTGLAPAAARHVDTFLAPSRFCIETHSRMGFHAPMTLLPNFVPESPAAPAEAASEATGGPYFLFVGRLEHIKGLQTLIPVFRRWRKARLLVAGTGAEAKHLQQLAQGDPNIEFLGRQSAEQLAPLYRNAVAVIVPSLCFEMFPLVVLEAFRERTPVIARNLGGLAEIVAEAGGGRVYDDDQQLIAALDQLLAEPACRRALGERGYETYRARWTTEAHLERYFEIIEQAGRKRAERPAPV